MRTWSQIVTPPFHGRWASTIFTTSFIMKPIKKYLLSKVLKYIMNRISNEKSALVQRVEEKKM